MVRLSAVAQQDILQLPKSVRARIYVLLERLQRWPRVSGAKPLRGRLAGYYRLRTGDYRLQFRVEGSDVIVDKVGHRDRFYDD